MGRGFHHPWGGRVVTDGCDSFGFDSWAETRVRPQSLSSSFNVPPTPYPPDPSSTKRTSYQSYQSDRVSRDSGSHPDHGTPSVDLKQGGELFELESGEMGDKRKIQSPSSISRSSSSERNEIFEYPSDSYQLRRGQSNKENRDEIEEETTIETERSSIYLDASDTIIDGQSEEWEDEDEQQSECGSDKKKGDESGRMVDRGIQTDDGNLISESRLSPYQPRSPPPCNIQTSQQHHQHNRPSSNRHSFSSSITARSRSSNIGIKSRSKKNNRLSDSIPRHGSSRTRDGFLKTSGKGKQGYEALIELQEENANDFQDLLCWIYPHLDCLITWNNVEGVSFPGFPPPLFPCFLLCLQLCPFLFFSIKVDLSSR